MREYAARLRSTLGRDLPPLVPIKVSMDEQIASDPLAPALAAARSGNAVVLVGPSGTGKSHVARHAALQLAADGHLPLWLRCREYSAGKFTELLGRATAPCSTLKPCTLLRRALTAGALPVLMLDGLNECPPNLRGELLEQVDALRLRMPAGLLITTTRSGDVAAPEHLEVLLHLPDAQERSAVAAAYGRPELALPDAFRTPYELQLAVSCADDLQPGAGPTDLFDTYVRRQAGSAAVRSALRVLAAEMDRQLRPSLTIAEATQRLERADPAIPAETIDVALANALLEVRQGRVSFTHEQLARFLTADKLVADAADVASLVHSLTDPRHADLRRTAVGLERDEDRAHELFLGLADRNLLTAALTGAFGPQLAERVRGDVCSALREARGRSRQSTFAPAEAAGSGSGRWSSPTCRNRSLC